VRSELSVEKEFSVSVLLGGFGGSLYCYNSNPFILVDELDRAID